MDDDDDDGDDDNNDNNNNNNNCNNPAPPKRIYPSKKQDCLVLAPFSGNGQSTNSNYILDKLWRSHSRI